MKKIKCIKRIKNHPIIGTRFHDGGEYGLGYFTIEKIWKYKEYSKCALARDGSHWFSKAFMKVRTDEGMVYKMPFCPWLKYYDYSGQKSISNYYDEHPFY